MRFSGTSAGRDIFKTHVGINSMINLLIRVLVICSFLWADLLWAAEGRPGSFKLGAILPLTGPLSIQGEPMRNAMLLAKDQLDKNNILQIEFEDNAFLPKNSVVAAKKLLNEDRVQALSIFGTNQGMAVVDLAEKKQVPFLSINVHRKVVNGKKYAVLLMPTVENLTAANLHEARKRGYKRVAIITTQQDACLLQSQIVGGADDLKIVYSGEVVPNETSIREHTLKIADRAPDAVFLSLVPPQGSLVSKSLRELGYKGELFGGLQIANQAELNASQGALLNAWVVAGDDRQAGQFYASYQKRFVDRPTAESIYAYEAIKLLLAAIASGNVNEFLHSVQNFPGESGTYSADGENGFTFKVVSKKFTPQGFEYLP